ncbi:Hypothetical predicted protein [Xyrichtys novacula]|uniref:RING-type E3 ubiquitin transferase n=1 Tax=Xyrichtys novacula TaxID=13765 RepID=A0AAV1FSQ0_XYRNO|nr:Hypothetical predicted protein [Xyrichtys novacula]
MSDSDCDSCCEHDSDSLEQGMKAKYWYTHINPTTFKPKAEIIERWSTIPWDIKALATQRMKLFAFWLPMLLQKDNSSTMCQWALEIGLINSSDDINMKQLRRIETVEAFLRALEKGTAKMDQTRDVFYISNMLTLHATDAVENAIHWLERSGETYAKQLTTNFGHVSTVHAALLVIFLEFSRFIQKMSLNLQDTMNSLLVAPPFARKEKSEEMKKKGNEKFKLQQYDEAVQFYSKAIKFNPENHKVYGNRALCFIRSKKYLKAVGDGKRACLIDPFWAKGHYRYCEALFLFGECKMAIEANIIGRQLCKDDQEGLKDLEQQHLKFVTEIQQEMLMRACFPGRPSAEQPKKTQSNKPNSTNKESKQQSFKADAPVGATTQSKAPEVKTNKQEIKSSKQAGKNEKTAQTESSASASKPAKSEPPSKTAKGESSTTPKKKQKKKNIVSETEKTKTVNLKAAVCKELKSMVQDAHAALSDSRSHNAEQAFSQALALVETNKPKELGLSTLDVLLLLYGRALALTEIGQLEELGEARRLLEKIKSSEERTFQCLVFYAVGRVFLKENRFAVALEQFSDSLQMVKNQITPGKLTWPLTKEIVKETQTDYFKELLESNLELCKFPPTPDAICRLEKCLGSPKTEIYLTDPDFKGFIQMNCCQSCIVEYHMACWKTLKTSPVFEKSEKDFLQESCFTPDCVGRICCIKIYGPTGLVKCKFEAAIPKPETQKKPKVNQKCTSLKNVKNKEERKLKRKQHRKSFQEKQEKDDEIVQKKEDSAPQAQPKAWLVYRDRVLLQISQNMELLREEKALQVSTLTSSLKPWLELDLSRGNQIAGRLLNSQQEQLETLGQAAELLLERKNRVWARVFVEMLSDTPDINPKLNNWARRLNNAGLNAAETFIERFAGHLEQLDLAFLLKFSPLQDVIIEKVGTRPELFSSVGLTVTEYLKQAPPHDTRLFIWTLEEHRDQYDSCHALLDEYFDMMDGHCSVLKKPDENENNFPMKSRGRKKKRREPKGVYAFPEMRSVTLRDDYDQDYFEDDSLSFLHPSEPFSVPNHLRERVAAFEEQYSSNGHRGGHYNNILDNNPDSTKESLFDYFAQILEEHGPLVADDPLLVGELENFPSVAQQKIKVAGGFEPFLLESLRFTKIGTCIGLMKHAVSLQQAGQRPRLDDLDDLDDLDEIVDLETNSLTPDSAAQTQVYPILPSPYVFGSEPLPHVRPAPGVAQAGDAYFSHWTNGDGQEHAPYFVPNGCEEADLYCSDGENGHGETGTSPDGVPLTSNLESLLKKDAAAQTSQETMRSVAVNTELHEGYESCQGDLNKKSKKNQMLKRKIEETSTCDKVDLKHKEDMAVLEDDIQKITANVQVTNKELALFQQKLEEEIKKDQNEKKANHEALRSLKVEIEDLQEEHKSLSRSIREKKSSYDTKLRDFLELSNQSAAEKMSLEDEIKRCKVSITSATRRSNNAQLSVVESSRDQDLYGLYRELANSKALLTKLDEAAHRFPHQELEMSRSTWRANVQEIEKKISTIETQYKERLDQVKIGRRVNELLPVNVGNQHKPPAAPMSGAAKNGVPPPSASSSSPPLAQQAAAEAPAAPPQTQHKPPTRTAAPPHSSTVFEKALEQLASMFPDNTRSELMRFVQEFRSSVGGSLSSMALQDVVGGVSQLILDHQERLSLAARSSLMGRGSPAQSVTPPLVNPTPVWQPLQIGHPKPSQSKALNVEDPCIICHDDMSSENMCVLECRHSFHKDCIRSWLREQSTCPTCRDHALLPEDFPMLPGRRRPAP